jgi:hypothetical protein
MKKMLLIEAALFSCGAVLGAPLIGAAQTVPVSGVTGSMALEGTVDEEYRAANTVIVKTADGVRHAFHFTKDLLVHGGKGSGVDALQGLRVGTSVVVHYTAAGDVESAQEIDRVGGEGLKMTEGMVTRVDRGQKQITVRFDNGTIETFRLTDRAAASVGKDIDRNGANGTKVVVYYTDEAGQKVAHYFKKTS